MTHLHILKTALSDEALSLCLAMMSETDACLLRDDAVLLLFKHTSLRALCSALPASRLMVLSDDLTSRGLGVDANSKNSANLFISNVSAVTQINYTQFVELCLAYDKAISW